MAKPPPIAEYRTELGRYSAENLVIKTKIGQMTKLTFNTAQRLVHDRLAHQMQTTGRVRAIVLKARQEGVSTYTAARFFRRINLYTAQTCLIVADQRKRAQVLFDIYDQFWRHLPDQLRPLRRYSSRSVLWFDGPSGVGLNSKVLVETARDVSVGRATTVQALHVSEMAFWERAEEVWVALAQSVPDHASEVIIESTANGVGNLFHQMWEAAEQGLNGYIPIFLPWWVHDEYRTVLTEVQVAETLATLTPWEREAMTSGIELDGEMHQLDPQQIAWRRNTIRDKLQGDERAFRQEYPSTAREAFLVSGNAFFEDWVLTEYEHRAKPPILRAELSKTADAIMLQPTLRGQLRVWSKPIRDGVYVIGADTATGREISAIERSAVLSEIEAEKGGRDYSCADVLQVAEVQMDANNRPSWVPCRRLVAQLHGRIVPEEFARLLRMLGYYYSGPSWDGSAMRIPALVAVERNHSSGETVIRDLKDSAYPRLYYHRQINQRTNRVTTQAGWVTNVSNRQPMLDELAASLREYGLDYPNADGIREMFTFVRGPDGKPEAQEGCHDDRVIAVALALQMARHQRFGPSRAPAPLERAMTATGV